jgi:hypothetical protein
MNSFLKGFISIFDWMFPPKSVDEILDDFYLDHPEIERDDWKALEKDFQKIWQNNN